MTDGARALPGVLPVDKPAGWTSHDVVARIRGALRVKRVGHAGTLDPMATGLLIVLVGTATRLARFVEAGAKTYEARVVFGGSTDTDDAEGTVTEVAAVPAQLADPAYAAGAVAALVGEHDQVPPAYAAIKVDGRKAYELARKGQPPELAARRITVHSARLDAVCAGPPVTWDITVNCSKGTYVRSLARDLGLEHGTLAHLGALRRTASGAIDVAQAVTVDDVVEQGPSGAATRYVDPLAAMGIPAMTLSADEAALVANGSALPLDDDPLLTGTLPDEGGVALVHGGRLLAVYRRVGGSLKAELVLAQAVPLDPTAVGEDPS